VTQVQGLRAARNAGIEVPKRVIDKAMDYLVRSQNSDGGVRYQVDNNGPGRPAITAAAVACWFNGGLYNDPHAKKALAYVKQNISVDGRGGGEWGHYFYTHLYMAQVFYLLGDEQWRPYFQRMSAHLLDSQADDGSWQGDGIGPTYGTAIALIILQLPYKYLPIMQR
jgi:squalene cyclase